MLTLDQLSRGKKMETTTSKKEELLLLEFGANGRLRVSFRDEENLPLDCLYKIKTNRGENHGN